jgi:hypothetical protein
MNINYEYYMNKKNKYIMKQLGFSTQQHKNKTDHIYKTIWPSGLRRYVQVVVN